MYCCIKFKGVTVLIVAAITLALLHSAFLANSSKVPTPHAYRAIVTVLPISTSGIGPHVPHLRVYLTNYTTIVGSVGSYKVMITCVYPPPSHGVSISLLNSSRRIIISSACWASIPIVWSGNATVKIRSSGNITIVIVKMKLKLEVLNISKDDRWPSIEINGVNEPVIVKPTPTPKLLRPNLTYVAVIDAGSLPPRAFINGTYAGNLIPFYIPWPKDEKDLKEYVDNRWSLTYMGAPLTINVSHQGLIKIYSNLEYGSLENFVAQETLFYHFNYLIPAVNGTRITDYGNFCKGTCLRSVLRYLISKKSNKYIELAKGSFAAGGANVAHYVAFAMITESLGFPLFIEGAPLPVLSKVLGLNIVRIAVFSADFNYSANFTSKLLALKAKMPSRYVCLSLPIALMVTLTSVGVVITVAFVLWYRRRGVA